MRCGSVLVPQESSLRTTPPLLSTCDATRVTRSLMCFYRQLCGASAQATQCEKAVGRTDVFRVVRSDAYELVEGHGGGEHDAGAWEDSALEEMQREKARGTHSCARPTWPRKASGRAYGAGTLISPQSTSASPAPSCFTSIHRQIDIQPWP